MLKEWSDEVKASMKMVQKGLNHHICLPSISICQFDQDKPKSLRIVSQGNPNSTVHWLCLAHEATSTYDQIKSREVISLIILFIYELMWLSSIIHSSRFEVWPWEVDQSSHLTNLRSTERDVYPGMKAHWNLFLGLCSFHA